MPTCLEELLLIIELYNMILNDTILYFCLIREHGYKYTISPLSTLIFCDGYVLMNDYTNSVPFNLQLRIPQVNKRKTCYNVTFLWRSVHAPST